LVVTHDRWFIDEVCTSMWEVYDGRVSTFEGGYSAYVLQRVTRDKMLQLAEDKRQNLLRKELAWLSRGARARATKPKFHLKIAHELIADEPPPRNTLELKRAAMSRLGKQVIEFSKLTKVLGETTILDAADFLIGPGDRLAIMGCNGVGKTTLLRLMTGELAPTSGMVKRGKTVQIAYLSQQLEELENLMERRVIEVLESNKQGYAIDGKHVSATELLKRLGFEQSSFVARVKDLSGGQKRRLQLLLTLLKEPNVMILDEPGNDFDTDMLTVLEDLLDTWPGTLILVSHDRYLVERVTDMQYVLREGRLHHLPGGVDEFLQGAAQDLSLESLQEPKLKPSNPHCAQDSERLQGAALSSSEAHEARKQLASIERKMHTQEQHIKKHSAALHELDPTDYIALGKAQATLTEHQDKLAELEAIWLDVSEKLGH
jgi:ATPase subunit of ABC transporter with duplicated ATPase domains